ncbi:MAG: T9SS type A sorting domain-containing protein [Ignavibacteria bacterium]|nr:T9SS type A sorting domain-containing protein [Ignavibacteria bacterium]
MKKLVFALAFLALSYSSFSQTFTFERISPAMVHNTDTNDYEIVSYSLLKVLSGTHSIRLIRVIQDLTPGWEELGTSICNYNNCFSSQIDTVTDSYTTGQVDDTVSQHFYCYDPILNRFVEGAGYVRLRAELVSDPSQYVEVDFRASTLGAIGIQQIGTIVNDFKLSQNYPNPFNPVTKISFSIPKSDYVSLRVYDMLGREVKALVSQDMGPGEYQVDFDAKGLSSGMYYYSLRSGEFVDVKKMVLVK